MEWYSGEVLLHEFLEPLGISAYRLSKDLKIPQTWVSPIIKGKRRITADTALRLSKYFGTSAKFWLGLQDDYDIEEECELLAYTALEPEIFLLIELEIRMREKRIISVLLKQSNKVYSRSFIGGFFIWLLLLSITPGFPVYAQYFTDNFEFERVTNKAGELQLSITNMGTLGNPRYGIDPYDEHPSMVYPKSTEQNHLFKGGVWLGGKVNDEFRVSTSAVTSTSGFTSIGMEGYEFFKMSSFRGTTLRL